MTGVQTCALPISATEEQVKSEIWREIGLCVGRSIWKWPKANLMSMTMPDGSIALGLATNDAVNFHGFHAPHVLLIVDEASGIEAEIFEAIFTQNIDLSHSFFNI